MNHLKYFNESIIKDLENEKKELKLKYKKAKKDILNKCKEDIEDCLLDVSDKFEMKFHRFLNGIFLYTFEDIEISRVNTFLIEMKRSINNLKRLDVEFGINLDGYGESVKGIRILDRWYDSALPIEVMDVAYEIYGFRNIDEFSKKLKDFIENFNIPTPGLTNVGDIVLEKINIQIFIS